MVETNINKQKWESVAMYCAVIVTAMFVGIVALHFKYTPDDAYIYFQYAKKIAQGKGFSFNGSEPSYGTTGPLWALFIAGGIKVGLTPYAVAKSFDFLFAGLSIIALYFLAMEILRNKMFAFFAAALFSMDAWFIRWSSSGMETSLAVLLSIVGVWLALRNYHRTSALVFGLLTLTRPESGLLFAIIFLRFFFATSNTKRSIPSRIVPALCYLAVLLPWLIFSYFHFGRIVPNTFYGKSAELHGVSDLLPTAITVIKLLSATQFLLIVTCLVSLFSKQTRSAWQGKYFLLIWVVSLPAFYVFESVQVVSRYLLIILPFLIVSGLFGLQQIIQSRQLSAKNAFLMLFFVAFVTFAQNQFLYWSKVKPHLDNFVNGTNECLKPIGSWLRGNTKEDALVFVPDVGIIGYYSDRNICDTGLITPDVGKAFRGVNYDNGMLQKRYDAVVHPDYIVDRSSIPERLTSSSLSPILTKQFPGLGISNTEMRYYTIYKVIK